MTGSCLQKYKTGKTQDMWWLITCHWELKTNQNKPAKIPSELKQHQDWKNETKYTAQKPDGSVQYLGHGQLAGALIHTCINLVLSKLTRLRVNAPELFFVLGASRLPSACASPPRVSETGAFGTGWARFSRRVGAGARCTKSSRVGFALWQQNHWMARGEELPSLTGN